MSEGMYSYEAPPPFIRLKTESQDEIVHYSALNECIPEEFGRLAEESLNETEHKKAKAIQRLEEFAQRKRMKLSDVWISIILRYCKYNLKNSEAKLEQYQKYHQEIVHSLASIDMKKIETIIDDMIFGVLPYRDRLGRVVIFTQPSFHLDLYSTDDIIPVCMAFVEFLQTFPMTSICGFSYIAECKTSSPYELICFLNNIRHAVLRGLKCSPVRYGTIDAINEFSLIRWFYKVLIPFLPGKITKRVSFNGGDLHRLQEHYPPEILPYEFGGTLGPLNNKFYKEKALNFIRNLKAYHNP